MIAGMDVELARSLRKVSEGLSFCRANVQKLMDALQVSSVDRRVIGRALSQLPPRKRSEKRVLARKLEELARMERHLEAQQAGLEAQREALAREASIRVEGVVYHKVDVFIGRAGRRLEDAMKDVTFRLSEDGQVKAYTNQPEGG